jgi:hypothetical protein
MLLKLSGLFIYIVRVLNSLVKNEERFLQPLYY